MIAAATTTTRFVTDTAHGRWRRAHHRVATAIEAELVERVDLGQTQFDILDIVEPEPIRANEVAHLVMLSPSGFTRVTDILVRRGFLVRVRDDVDRRGVNIEITNAGRTLVDAARPVMAELVEKHFTGQLSDELLRSVDCAAALLVMPPADGGAA